MTITEHGCLDMSTTGRGGRPLGLSELDLAEGCAAKGRLDGMTIAAGGHGGQHVGIRCRALWRRDERRWIGGDQAQDCKAVLPSLMLTGRIRGTLVLHAAAAAYM